jgi:hypothetical protein
MDKIKENEYIVINFSKLTARVIEIYVAPEEFDRLFLIKYPSGDSSLVFESQVTALNHAS